MGVPGLFAGRIQQKNRCYRGSPVSTAIFLRCQARTNQMVAIQRHHHQVFPSIQSDPPVLQCCEDRSAPKWRRIAAFGAGIANCVPHWISFSICFDIIHAPIQWRNSRGTYRRLPIKAFVSSLSQKLQVFPSKQHMPQIILVYSNRILRELYSQYRYHILAPTNLGFFARLAGQRTIGHKADFWKLPEKQFPVRTRTPLWIMRWKLAPSPRDVEKVGGVLRKTWS